MTPQSQLPQVGGKAMTDSSSPQRPNTIGNASLILGIASLALVFGIGLCALVGVQQNWIQIAGTPLFGPAVRFWASWAPCWAWGGCSAQEGRGQQPSPVWFWDWRDCVCFLSF
jgi:hypothetical protein